MKNSTQEEVRVPERLYAIVDVETTGGTTYYSRITEISIFLWNGERVIDEFSSLINPQIPIPAFITQLTGIDDGMVAGAPTFEEVAQRVLEITADAVFVAHNVNFDFSMIAYELKRLGFEFQRKKLCTVKLSRKFLPGYSSYSLGRLCAQLDIVIHGRHRARGDAEATTILFSRIYELSGGDPGQANEKWIKSLPEALSRETVDRLPETAGIFYFLNEEQEIIYTGSAPNVYKKVTTHLAHSGKKSIKIRTELTDIDFEPTGSELIARLKVASAIEKHRPKYNALPRKRNGESCWTIGAYPDMFGYLHLDVLPVASSSTRFQLVFGQKKEAESHLQMLCKRYQLCERLCGLRDTPTCNDKMCMKACLQREPAVSYNVRVEQALHHRFFSHDSFVILDKGFAPGEQSFVMIEENRYVGYGSFHRESEALTSWEDFRDFLHTDHATMEKMEIIQSFISTHKPQLIIA